MLCVVTTRHPNTAQTKNSYLTQYNFEDQARQFDKGGYGIDAFDTYCKSRPAVNTLDSRIYNVFGDGDKGRPRKGQRAIQLLIDSATNVDRRERPGIEDFTTLLQIFDEQYRQHQDQENQTGDFDDEGFYEEAKGWIEASTSSSSLYSSDFCRRKQTLIKYLMSNLGTSPSSETDLLTTHAETVQSTMEGAPKSLREAQAEAVRTPNQHKPVRKPKRPAAHERSEGVLFDITVCCLLLLVLLFAINQPTRVWWLRWLPLPSIQFEVAQSKLYGENGQALDYEEAFKELKALADTGYQPARQVVADCLDNGIGTDINHDKAEDYREAIKTFGTPEMSINPEGNQ